MRYVRIEDERCAGSHIAHTHQMADRWRMDGIQRHRGASEGNVASIFIGYVDMHQTNLNVTYLWHRQDPLIDDDVLIDNMRYIVRSTLRDLYTEYTTGALAADDLQFLETYPSQLLELRVWCETVEADCIRPGWVKYLQGSIWFDLGSIAKATAICLHGRV